MPQQRSSAPRSEEDQARSTTEIEPQPAAVRCTRRVGHKSVRYPWCGSTSRSRVWVSGRQPARLGGLIP